MMIVIHDAETQRSELAAKVLADGETIAITNAGMPVVDMLPHRNNRPRTPGGYAIDMTGFDDDSSIYALVEGI